jgi:hypothetical protein
VKVLIPVPTYADPDHMVAAYKLGMELMEREGLKPNQPGGWKFEFDHAPVRAGRCNHSRRTISISRHVTAQHPMAEVEDTILHEIAHALTTGGHDAAWKRECYRLGCRPQRCYEAEIGERWIGTCPNGHTYKRHQRGGRKSCSRCAGFTGRFDERYEITWAENDWRTT